MICIIILQKLMLISALKILPNQPIENTKFVFYYHLMYLQSISLVNFKNIEAAEITFSPRINCFVGNNGVGKTNLLDAIHYLMSLQKLF